MMPSDNCLNLIKQFEGCRLTAYMPTANDVPTIGWGSTGPDIHDGLVWSQAQADARLATDVARFSASVNAMLTGPHVTTQNQFDAMVSFAYNEGAQRLKDSWILAYHELGDYQKAAPYFMHYTKQNHIVLGGLVRRREMEQQLYLTDLPVVAPSTS